MPQEPTQSIKLATLSRVREYCEHEPVELWLSSTGRITIRAWNECGNNYTDIDLIDLLVALLTQG